jgi:hypothetical protein
MAQSVKALQIAKKGMLCPRCSAKHARLNGIVRGVQRYHCPDCQYNFLEFNARKIPKFLDSLFYLIASVEGEKIGPDGSRTHLEREDRLAEISLIVFENLSILKNRLSQESAEQHGTSGLRGIHFYKEADSDYKQFRIIFDYFDVYLTTKR